MTLAELAGYLHLGQKTCLELVTSGKLPGILIEKQWRFRRDAIDEWLDQHSGSGVHFEQMTDGMNVPLSDLVDDDAVISDMNAKDAVGAIEELAARAYSNRWLNDKPWFVGAVVEREALASTAMEGGVAFLHTRARDTKRIARPFIIIGRSYQGIDFGAPDKKPTYLFFLLGLKHDSLHLPILGRLARVLRDPKNIAKLRAAPVANKLRATLVRLDTNAMKNKTTPIRYAQPDPERERKSRLRAIMRVNARRKLEERRAEEAERKETARKERAAERKKKKEAEAKKKAAATKKKASSAKKKAAATKKKTSSAKKKAAASKKKTSSAKKKADASKKKKAAATKKKTAAAKKKTAAAKKKTAATKKKTSSAKKKTAAAKKKTAAAKKKTAAAKKKTAAAKKKTSSAKKKTAAAKKKTAAAKKKTAATKKKR